MGRAKDNVVSRHQFIQGKVNIRSRQIDAVTADKQRVAAGLQGLLHG